MIKLEHVVLASPEQMEFIIEGMRNPMNSWDKSDSAICRRGIIDCPDNCYYKDKPAECQADIVDEGSYVVGPNDLNLMKKLANAGTDHRKFMRMMPVYVRITAPLYWWKEFDTYKVGTVANSCSTMHKIQEKEFTLKDFSCEHLNIDSLDHLQQTIDLLNEIRDNYINYEKYTKQVQPNLLMTKKDVWWQMIQLLPSSYNQTRNVMMNYEVLANIYKSRMDHKLDEWREFCKWIESLPYSELICGPEFLRKKLILKED